MSHKATAICFPTFARSPFKRNFIEDVKEVFYLVSVSLFCSRRFALSSLFVMNPCGKGEIPRAFSRSSSLPYELVSLSVIGRGGENIAMIRVFTHKAGHTVAITAKKKPIVNSKVGRCASFYDSQTNALFAPPTPRNVSSFPVKV
jgi:hypothetical protein